MLSRPSPVAPLPPPCGPLPRQALKACAHPQEAFWCLVQICEVYLPGYYGPHMVRGRTGRAGWGWALRRQPPVLMGEAAGAVRLDARCSRPCCDGRLPRVHKHLQKVWASGLLLYLPEWFLCLFARLPAPFPTVLRSSDAFF